MNKPTGISTHGAFSGDLGMQEWIKLHLGIDTFVCSRLDKGTSGVLLFARTAEASKLAQNIHEQETSSKEYCFLSHADSVQEFGEAHWTDIEPVCGKSASTVFERVGGPSGRVMYKAFIKRGRTHQIRNHAARKGLPLLGDAEYGGKPFPRVALHCHRVNWPGIELPIVAPLPHSFREHSEGVLGFADAFWSSFDRRLSWPAGITNAFRLVHRGEWPALDCAVDLYAEHLCVWIYNDHLPFDQMVNSLAPSVEILASHYGAKGWVVKRNVRDPHNSGLVSEQKIVHAPPPDIFNVIEHGILSQVTLTHRQHVGLFLDQRDNRRRVSLAAPQARVANLFSFTCSFSAAAAAAGAEVVFSVDAAQSVLEIGKQNFASNNLTALGRGKFVCDDVRKWLSRQNRRVLEQGEAAKYGVIICDPPVFSSTKEAGKFHVQEQWKFLAEQCASLLTKNGQAFFSTNHRGGERRFYHRILQSVFSEVEELSPPLDFPELDNHEEHVKLFRCLIK